MIERTHRRLRQARFFYQHLVDAQRPPDPLLQKGDPEAFGFYFFAFIQTARTVTWTLGNEHPEKWNAWKPIWEANLTAEDKKLLKIATELRNAEAKRGGADLTKELEQVVIDAFVEVPHEHPPHLNFQQYELRQQTMNHLVHYLEDKEGKEEITEVCQRYLNFLDKMVKDFCEDHKMWGNR
jgi:hypothetical protein